MAENKPKQERIAQIIEAAIHEFVEKGFEKTTMASIAARANLTKGGVYHHFGSKDEILLAANQTFTAPVQDLLEEISRLDSPSLQLKTYIEKYLAYWADHTRELTFTFLSITKSLSNPMFFKPFDDYVSGLLDAFEDIYHRGIEIGEFKPHDTRGRALALNAALDGVTMYLATSQHLEPDEIINHFVQVFIKDISLG